jgi:hypothetical protein
MEAKQDEPFEVFGTLGGPQQSIRLLTRQPFVPGLRRIRQDNGDQSLVASASLRRLSGCPVMYSKTRFCSMASSAVIDHVCKHRQSTKTFRTARLYPK